VESPLTTLWEFWDLGGSYNHPWAGGVLDVMSEQIAGVRPTAPGWATFEIRPQLGDLKVVDVTMPTIKGPLKVSIRRGEKTTVKLDAPPGTSGKVILGGGKSFDAGPGLSQFESAAQ
jgi:hypothetical protein